MNQQNAMTNRQAENYAATHNRLSRIGFDENEIQSLFRIERTLQRWGERECGDEYGCIERDETTGKPYWLNAYSMRRHSIPDREAGAKRRLAAIMASHPELVAYHQSDCRGCNLYILRKDDVPAGSTLDSCYTRGIAVCY